MVFVNVTSHSDIENVLNDFEDILLLADPPKKLTVLQKTRFSIQFQYGGFDVDLLPAMDFVTTPVANPASEQAFYALQCVSKRKDKAYHYSSALVETQLAFMRKQSPFVHDLVRLCKLWNKSLLIDGYISGRSTLIELVAVHAGKKEEDRTCFKEKQSLLSAFDTFLTLMQHFGQIKIEFDFDPLQPQRSIDQFPQLKSNDHLKCTTPFVIEPANPFNNLAGGVTLTHAKLLESFATETRRRLDLYVKMTSVVACIPLNQLFEPQPTIHVYISDAMRKFVSNLQFLVGTRVNEGPASPTMTIRKEEKYKSTEVQIVLKSFQSIFSIVSQGFISSKNWQQKCTAAEASSELQTEIYNLIDTNILGIQPRTWINSTVKHEDQDVTFYIPSYFLVNGKEEKVSVLVSLTAQ